MVVSREIVDFLESGISVSVGTCDRAGVPDCIRALAVKFSDDHRRVTVLFSRARAERPLRNAAENPRVAVTLSRPMTHRSIQLKGTVLRAGDADEALRPVVERQVEGFAHELELAGMPRRHSMRIVRWPCAAIELRVEELYEQTPGPEAGKALAP